jgi:hypothetical protein
VRKALPVESVGVPTGLFGPDPARITVRTAVTGLGS